MTKKLLSICLSLLLFVSLLPAVSLAQEGVNLIYLKASKSMLNVDEILTVYVEGENLTNLYGNEVRVTFDPTMLEYVDQNISVTHNLSGGFPVKKLESIPLIFAYTQVGNSQGVSGNYRLYTLTFKAKKAGAASINLTRIDRIVVSGSTNVSYTDPTENRGVTVQINHAPTNISLSGTSVAENASAGTTVGTLGAEDPDTGETFTYTLVSGEGGADNASFEIIGNELKTKAVFDYETKNIYNIRVQVKDSHNAAFEKEFGIAVTDVNETPTDINLSGAAVAENAEAGMTVGTLGAEDPNAGDTFTYTLVSGEGGADNASFEIIGNELKTKVVFDYETKNTYNIRVQVKDSHNAAFEKIFGIAVTNVNELPANITLSGTSVSENASADTAVGTLGAEDPDAGETFTYTLVDGEGGADNASFEIIGNELKTKAVFDYETKNAYSIRAQVKDSADHVYAKAFTIHVTDVTENVNPGPIGPTPTPTPTPSPTPTSKPTPGPTPSVSPVAVVASPDANGVATANITEEELSKAIQNPGVKQVKIEVNTSETADEVVVNLPAQQVQTADSSGITRIEVDTGLATVSFDPEVLKETLGANSANVQLSVAKVDQSALSDDIKDKVGNNPVYDFNLSVDGNKISEFKGNEVRVGIPYTLKPDENPNKIVIYYINDEGELEVVKNGKFNPETGKVEFKAKHFSKYAASYAVVTFQDIAHLDWATDAIEGLAARTVVQGTAEGQFSPDGKVTRAQFITMLMNAFDLSAPGATTTLKDVEAGAWYYNAISNAQQLKIVEGKIEDTFGINDQITRQDMAVMLFRALKVMGVELRANSTPAAFEDQASISGYALDAVKAMQQAGIIEGVGNGKFAPIDDATRAQAAVIIYRLIDNDE